MRMQIILMRRLIECFVVALQRPEGRLLIVIRAVAAARAAASRPTSGGVAQARVRIQERRRRATEVAQDGADKRGKSGPEADQARGRLSVGMEPMLPGCRRVRLEFVGSPLPEQGSDTLHPVSRPVPPVAACGVSQSTADCEAGRFAPI